MSEYLSYEGINFLSEIERKRKQPQLNNTHKLISLIFLWLGEVFLCIRCSELNEAVFPSGSQFQCSLGRLLTSSFPLEWFIINYIVVAWLCLAFCLSSQKKSSKVLYFTPATNTEDGISIPKYLLGIRCALSEIQIPMLLHVALQYPHPSNCNKFRHFKQ